VIDTLAKFVRVKDINDYNAWLEVFAELRRLGSEFPQTSILCLLHAKKAQQEDVFDAMLGSSALRGEFDTNAAIYRDGDDRVFATEARMGRAVVPTILKADVVEQNETQIARSFSLGRPVSEVRSEQRQRAEKKRKQSLEERVIEFLSHCQDESALYGEVIHEVEGNRQKVIGTVKELIEGGVLVPSGTIGSPTDPYTVRLARDQLKTHAFIGRFGETIQ
jgi:hypothetical protein